MILPADKPSERRTVLIAVVTAGLTTAVTSLVTWAIEEIKAKHRASRNDTTGDSE